LPVVDERPAANSTSRSCPHCGAEIGEYASFCWECQRSVAGPVTAEPATVSAPYAPAPPATSPSPAATWYPSPPPVAPPPVGPPPRRFRLGSTIAALVVVGAAILGGILVSEAISDDDGSDDGATAGDERPGSEHLGQWLVQIQTFDSSISADRVQASVDALAAEGLEVEVLLSDDFAALEPGSWVFYESALPTADEAAARCVELGRTEQNCFARLLSDDPADRDQVQFPSG
jgi:hypothetical protein